nr:Chain C, MET-VAL-MET-GLU-LEU-ILE-ARG-MET-ILE [unidentified influenza virus]
MVMELIRMI